MKKPTTCDQFERGLCKPLSIASGCASYCPPERAENLQPGECCHHPGYRWREKLTEMSQAGVKLRRYGAKLRDFEFVAKLYEAFRRAKSKRA